MINYGKMHGRKSTLAGGLGSSRWGGTSPSMFKQKTNSASKVPHALASGPGMAGRSQPMAGPPKIQPVQNPAAKVGFPKHQPPSALSSSAGGSGSNPLSWAPPRPGHGPNPTKPTPWKPGGWQDWGNPFFRPVGGGPNLGDWLRPGGRPFPYWPGNWPGFPRPPVWQDPHANENPQQRWERLHGDAWRDQQGKEEWGRQYQDQHGGGYIPYWQRGLTQSQIQQQQYQHRQQNQQHINDYWAGQGLTSPDQIEAHKQQQALERWQRHDPSQMETGQQSQADKFRQDKIWKQAEEEAARQNQQQQQTGGGQPPSHSGPAQDFLIAPPRDQMQAAVMRPYYNKNTGETGWVGSTGYKFKPGDHGWVMGEKPEGFKPKDGFKYQPQGGGQQQVSGGQQVSGKQLDSNRIQLPGYKESNKPPGPNEHGYKDSSGQWWVKPKPEVGSGQTGGPDVGFPGQTEPGGGAPPINPIDVGFPVGSGDRSNDASAPWYDASAPLNSQGYLGEWGGQILANIDNWYQQYANPAPPPQGGHWNAADHYGPAAGMGPFDTPQNPGAGWTGMFPGGDYTPPPENPWEGHPTGFDPEADYANTGWGGPQASYYPTGAGYYKPAYRGWY